MIAAIALLLQAQVVETAKLAPLDPAPGEFYGFAAALVDADTAIVGAPHDGEKGNNAGAVYVHSRAGGAWVQSAKLTASDATSFDFVGRAVAARPGLVAAGAYNAEAGPVPGAGAVYLFEGPPWTQTAKLVADDPGPNVGFGFVVAVSGNRMVIGTRHSEGAVPNAGAAYVFERAGSTWTQRAKLLPGDPVEGGFFGLAVAVLGDTIAVGCPGDTALGPHSGSAYVFRRLGDGSWIQTAKLLAPGGAAEDRFGLALALSPAGLLVGAPSRDFAGLADSGSVFAFAPGTWSFVDEFGSPKPVAGGRTGHALSALSTYALVGAPGPSTGTAFLARRSGSGWSPFLTFVASDPVPDAEFGYSVAIGPNRAVVGSMRNDSQAGALPSGQAYVFGP